MEEIPATGTQLVCLATVVSPPMGLTPLVFIPPAAATVLRRDLRPLAIRRVVPLGRKVVGDDGGRTYALVLVRMVAAVAARRQEMDLLNGIVVLLYSIGLDWIGCY